MIKYTTNIKGLHSHSEYAGAADVIYTIYWSITAATYYGKQATSEDNFIELPLDTSSSFVEKINIDNALLSSWVEQHANKQLIQNIKNELVEQISVDNINIRNYIQNKINNSDSFVNFSLFAVDLSNMDLSNLDLSNSTFTNVNFSNCNLSNTNFSNCNLSKSIFHDANLTNAILDNVKLTYAIGNGKEIVTWYVRKIKNCNNYLEVNFTKDILYFGCFGSTIDNWKRFKDNLLIEHCGDEDLIIWRNSEIDHYSVIEQHFLNADYILPSNFSWGEGIFWYPQDSKNYIWDEETISWKEMLNTIPEE